MERKVKGYKVFNPDWTCRGKQYSCPGNFEEDVTLSVCNSGMHFCKKASDCFNYYQFDPNNHVAEVVARGNVVEDGDKCATDKLEIIREIPWAELLEIVNTGKWCTGYGNSGDYNSGDWNSGNWNSGDWNSGNCNSGDWNSGDWNSGNRNSGNRNSGDYNSGDWNSGDYNSGDYNSGNCNSGDWNSGDWNSGNRNSGNRNSGDYNSGDWNSGDYNSGNRNSGNWNSGDWNSGDWNSGDWNSGDWNKTDFSNGCFNTVEPKIYLFNKPSSWTYRNWLGSEARYLMKQIQGDILEWVRLRNMTDDEKTAHPESETTGGYLKKLNNSESAAIWWRSLDQRQKNIIMSIPNFDKAIFKEITGIDVDKED